MGTSSIAIGRNNKIEYFQKVLGLFREFVTKYKTIIVKLLSQNLSDCSVSST